MNGGRPARSRSECGDYIVDAVMGSANKMKRACAIDSTAQARGKRLSENAFYAAGVAFTTSMMP